MIKGLLFISIFLFSFIAASGQIPSGYYDSADGLSGDALRTALNNIIDGHTELSYAAAKEALKVTDEDTLNSSNVICFYTGWSYGKTDFGNGSEEWNREHVWSKSHGDFGDSPPEGTDIHQLRPTDASVNSAKNNRDFDTGITQYIDGSGPTECYKDTDIWEPRDEVKGDVARIIFYMATRYEGENSEEDLEIVDYVDTAPNYEPLYGKLTTLLQWHQDDPVDDWEIGRNDIVYYSYQNNRNPYVDHPEYVNSIWGSTNPEPSNHVASFSAAGPTSSSITLTWNDNDGTNDADKFLLKINTSGTFTAPVDGVENSDDTDISDGIGHVNVNHGDETYTFTGLDESTIYYFEIYPYSNFGTDIDYKTDGTVPNSSASTIADNMYLIISEVTEPNDNWESRFVELYNAGNAAIDFNSEIWHLCLQSNGGSSWRNQQLTGIISAKGTFVIALDSLSFLNSYLFDADIKSSVINGNGNDGYFLYSGGNHSSGLLVDAYGVIDQDGYGEDWEYTNSKAVRKHSDTIPSATWQASQWIINTSANDEHMTPGWHRIVLNWTGAQSSSWEDKDNWNDSGSSSNYPPDAGCKVIIPSTSTSPDISSEASCDFIEIGTEATLSISSGSLIIGH